MIDRKVPAWFSKAKEIAARVTSPVGQPFAAKKQETCATIHLYDAIGVDPWSGTGIDPADVVAAVADAKGSSELAVHINSPGGLVFDGIAIANAIRAFPGKKTCYVDGLAASIASIIALAGDRCVMNEGSMFMIHDPMGGVFAMGTAEEIEDEARKTCAALRKVRENLLDIYTSSTGRSMSEVSAWMTGETWMTAQEAMDRGFCDEVRKSDPEPDSEDPDEAEEGEEESRSRRPAASLDDRLALVSAKANLRKPTGASPGNIPGQPGTKTASPATAGKGK